MTVIYMVFYEDLLYGEYTAAGIRMLQAYPKSVLYNNSYVYDKRLKCWYRMDFTPLRELDVPKTLKTLILLLNQ